MASKLRNEQFKRILTANRTYYIRADGNDANDGLADSAGGAFLTIAHANSVIASIDKAGFDITLQFGAGTWNEDAVGTYGAGDGKVTWMGTLSVLEASFAATSVSNGSTSTAGTVTKVGQFTGNTYAGKIAYFVTDDAYRIIYSNTNDVLTLCDFAPSATAQNVIVYDWGTLIDSFYIDAPGSIFNLDKLSFIAKNINSAFAVYCAAYTKFQATTCDLYVMNNVGGNVDTYDCYWHNDASGSIVSCAQSGSLIIRRGNIKAYHTSASGIVCSRGAYVLVYGGTLNGTDGAGGEATNGIWLWNNASGQAATTAGTYGYFRIYNCDTGIWVTNSSVFSSKTFMAYSGNTTNENAEAASYGLIV